MNKSEAENIVKSFEGIKVLVIGDMMVDSYIKGAIERISPEAPVPVVRVTSRDKRPGGAANVALNLKSMGADPVLCSVIGNDMEGKGLVGMIEKYNLSTAGIVLSDNRPTTVKNRVMSGHHHVVRIDEESEEPLNGQEKDDLLNKIREVIVSCQVVVFEDYDKGVIDENLILEVKKLANLYRIPIVADPKKKNFSYYSEISILKPNLIELNQYYNKKIPSSSISAIREASKDLCNVLQCEGVMITLADKGIYILYNGEDHYEPAHYRDVADVSGAGDTVISMLALALAARHKVKRIAALANLAGGLVCEYQGVVPLDKGRFVRELEGID